MCSSQESYLSDSLDRRPVFKQQLHHFDSVLLASDVKGSETILHTERKEKKNKLSVERCVVTNVLLVMNVPDCVTEKGRK